jgi:hypothetical protein
MARNMSMTKTEGRGKKSRSPLKSRSATQSAMSSTVSHDQIAMRAYEIFLSRGAADGSDFDDWLQAEREVAAQ